MNKPIKPQTQRATTEFSSPLDDDSSRLHSILARTMCRVHALVPSSVRRDCQDGGCPQTTQCLGLARNTLSYVRDIKP